ncbi:MAG TPA: DUF2279 domain-containing protein [Chitinophagaceae bacterium]|nr:DUF2279 domain-containing protein [Chitinophagaceae bacterium]
MLKIIFIPVLLFLYSSVKAQDSIPLQQVSSKKVWLIAGANVALWTGSFIALNKAWYADYPKSKFHFFNDNSEWNQMDKIGHAWTAYRISRLSAGAWRWTGLSDKKSAWIGGISGVAYQSIIEIQDGFSDEWGFSWGDMTANVIGSAAFTVQALTWKEQRLQIKLSNNPYQYPDDLIERRDQLFGKSLPERMLKDYNSQTYWISANLESFFPKTKLPAWLNFSAGYASELMLGGHENKWIDKIGVPHDRTDIPRVRRFFIAPDLEFVKIKTRSKLLRTVFLLINGMKLPAPALELNSKGRIKLHGIYF